MFINAGVNIKVLVFDIKANYRQFDSCHEWRNDLIGLNDNNSRSLCLPHTSTLLTDKLIGIN